MHENALHLLRGDQSAPDPMSKSIKLVNVVGARPQFIKLAPVLRAIAEHNQAHPDLPIRDILVHTGQHYDYEMSGVFFEELGLKHPDYHLGVGSGSHGAQTGEMLRRIEEVLLTVKPDVVVVYGDTNSTLAGALAAVKLHFPVAHVEAGLRSFNRHMPEEINRVLTDHMSEYLFCPTETAVKNLEREGITRGVYLVGDVMYDALLQYMELAERRSTILRDLGLEPRRYALATVHRAENTDDPARLGGILEGLHRIVASGLPVVAPLHPRTRTAATRYGLSLDGLKVLPPVSYLDMLMLEKHARVILTDSGGVQKEAFKLSVPCLTFRDQTEWPETLVAGANRLVPTEPALILSAVHHTPPPPRDAKESGPARASATLISLLLGNKAPKTLH